MEEVEEEVKRRRILTGGEEDGRCVLFDTLIGARRELSSRTPVLLLNHFLPRQPHLCHGPGIQLAIA